MRYVLTVIWFEYRRYLAAILVVAAGTALMGLQVGITLGVVSMVSTPVDRSTADVWVAVRNTPSCDLGAPLARDLVNRLHLNPDVAATDELIQSYATWTNPARGNALVVVLGANLAESGLGPAGVLSARQRVLLTELGGVILDESERERLGIRGVGDTGEIFGTRVRVVGFTRGVGSITGPYVFCSLQTARLLLRFAGYDDYTTTFLLARCRDRGRVPAVVQALGSYSQITARSAEDFSVCSRLYWLTTTKAGLAIGFIALLGLVIGALVTSQTLYSATLALAKELALLRALGAPLSRLMRFVLAQAAVVGAVGVALGLGLMEGLFRAAEYLGAPGQADWRIRLGAVAVAMLMALPSGVIALLSLRRTDPIQLLR